MLPATTSKSGLLLNFPSVCKVPGPPAPPTGGTPVPYPNVAKTAQQAQKKITTSGKPAATTRSRMPMSSGNEPGTQKGMVSMKNAGAMKSTASMKSMVSMAAQSEIMQIKGLLTQLNSKLQMLESSDPDDWQAILQEYVAAASALYVTKYGD